MPEDKQKEIDKIMNKMMNEFFLSEGSTTDKRPHDSPDPLGQHDMETKYSHDGLIISN